MKIRIFFIASLAIFIASCTHNHSTEAVDLHHEEVKIQITAYSDQFELFAEADPFIVGKTGSILSHFSHLPNFTALEEGSNTARLIVDGNETSQTLAKPTRKGIYKFELKPETEGKGKLIFDIETENGKFQLIVPEVQVYSDEHDAIHAAEAVVVSSTNATVFTKEQSWKIDFATGHPTIEPFGQVIKAMAQVQSSQDDEILITSKTNGIVKFLSDNILEGKAVNDGQALFLISGNSLSNNNSSVRYLEAQNNFEKAESDYTRLKALAQDQIVSQKELLEAKHRYENAKVIYDNLNENFDLSGQKVTSTMAGYVNQVIVKNGQYVEAGQPLAIISQNKLLLLRAEVQRKYAPVLGTINSAIIRALPDNKTYTLEELNGKVLSWGRNTNADNYLIPVNIQIDNTGTFVPGGFVELFLKTLSNTQALTIPNSALLEEQGNYFVFVQVHPELFEKREVKTGASDGLKTEILKGLSPEERIVSKGAILIKLAQATGTLDAHSGHVH